MINLLILAKDDIDPSHKLRYIYYFDVFLLHRTQEESSRLNDAFYKQ